ncbi:hypothetical protein TFKS16_0107 [Tannerella forsythia KS16]|uniref:lantibiotic dehydratase family protein n=1 Tax=Tannerella forsythia TaxID=28112 RepID=UPI000618B823|nr:lantibiotic dehydratase family protein [Tannerella forsythia]BAR50459.1 hypothetical protein TFKS16_0107 [Tannerella forsythia KS16]
MYIPFNKIIIRTPRFSYQDILEKDVNFLSDKKYIDEAIYIASSDLFDEWHKYKSNQKRIIHDKEKRRISTAVVRYIYRMSTRCTPFGLFAGCSVGCIGEETSICLDDQIYRHTRLDMQYLCTLAQYISEIPEIKLRLKYHPNDSLYLIGNQYRYIEYSYRKDARKHQINSVEKSVYLRKILEAAKGGKYINELCEEIVSDGITPQIASEYINELIESQILLNELSPYVTGDDYLSYIIFLLKKLDTKHPVLSLLESVGQKLDGLDKSKIFLIEKYQQIISLIKQIGAPYNEHYLFQVDMNRGVVKASLGNDIIKELQSALSFLNRITPSNEIESNLSRFAKSFQTRYESREVPILEVLDPEIGIGYPVNQEAQDLSPLIDDVRLPVETLHGEERKVYEIQHVLLEKIIDATYRKETEIVLNDTDFKQRELNWDDLPSTIHVMFELISAEKGNVLLRIKSVGGTSAANLLARFAYTDVAIEDLINQITQKEQSLNEHATFAEIAHLPDSRVGNILFRPHIRECEIVYLSNSTLSEEQKIHLSDVMISYRLGRLVLRSKKWDREMIPRLTNAHNYSRSSIPVYRFLCDMQHQGRTNLYFNWGYLEEDLDFLPRVRYKRIILSPASWKFKTADIKSFFEQDDSFLMAKIAKWKKTYNLPDYVVLPDGDNELFVNMNHINNIYALWAIVKQRTSFRLNEWLFDMKKAVVLDKQGKPYTNECIVAFSKNEKEQ